MQSDLARAIYEVAHLSGSFTLRSGAVSNEYFDKFQFTSRPDLLEAVAEAMAAIVPSDVQVLAGLQLGGVPLAAALALKTRIPAVYVCDCSGSPMQRRRSLRASTWTGRWWRSSRTWSAPAVRLLSPLRTFGKRVRRFGTPSQ